MAQQKALLLLAKQGAFAIRNIDIPKPGPGDIIVKIVSAALNPMDWKIHKFGALYDTFPVVLGVDVAGTVEHVGESVAAFKKGDRVLLQGSFTNDEKAAFQQYTIVPSELAAKIPENISFDEAATIPLAICTAVQGFYNPVGKGGAGLTPFWEPAGAGKYKDQGILIFGGSSAVGQCAIQLARLSGFSPIVATASPHSSDLVKSLGATHLIDRKADVVAEAAKIFSTPPNLVFNAIQDVTHDQAWNALGPKGTLIHVHPAGPHIDGGENGKSAYGIFGGVHIHRDIGRSLYANLTDLLQSGKIKPNRVEVLPGGLAGIEEGLKRMAEDKVSGAKLIVRPQETP